VQGFIYKHQMGHEIREQDPDAVERIAHLLEEEIGRRFGKGPVTCQLRCLVGIALG
jgi:predicted Zn-dependent protease with MMP-like domain